jgi:quinolinate synthase
MASFNELQEEILRLKKEKNALILAHYYVPIDGVRFMGESAKILSPDKTVLLPSPDAGCPMADMVEVEDVLRLKAEHPNAVVMCYVNSSAEVKAVCDVCCTSSSAIRIAKAIPEQEIIFVPDKHLGTFVAQQVPEKTFYMHDGFCPTHHKVTEEDIVAAKRAHPNAVFAVHPECRDEVVSHADFIGSTAEILDFARNTDAEEIIIGTENEIVERLMRELPNKKIYNVKSAFICPNMKKVTLEALYNCLKTGTYEVTLPQEDIDAAKRSLDRMVQL